MDAIRQWGFAVCCAAVAGGIAQMLAPHSSLQKVFRMTLGAFFLCSLLYPMLSFSLDLSMQPDRAELESRQEVADRLQESIDGQFLSEFSGTLEEQIRKKLGEMGIMEAEIAVYINGEEAQGLTAEQVVAEIVLERSLADRHDDLVRNLEYQLGITVRLGYA